MLSWRLWRALIRPQQRSPLYRRAFVRQQALGEPLPPLRIPFLGMFKNLGLIILPVLLVLIGAPMLILLYYLALLTSPLLVPIANTVYGLIQVNSVSGSIAREREQQTYDVICTAPPGTLGMHWSYCTGWIHYHRIYRFVLLAVLVTGIVASIFGLSSQAVFGADGAPITITILRGTALAALFVIDYGQSIVLSSLVTLLLPAQTDNESNARLWAVCLFLALQLGVYIPTLLFGVFALPSTFRLIGFDPLLSDVLTPLLLVAFFAVLREAIIVGLWHGVKEQLSTTSVELDALTHLAL